MRYFASYARLPGGIARDVVLEIDDGRFTSITTDADPAGATRLPGILLPGFANAHSHAFHRALRGRTHDGVGTFWTWRDPMYAVADRLDPDSYLALARATYAEMALAGVTAVGEFHYLHHGPNGARYADPNAMAEALRQAARDAGIRLTLLDACYLTASIGDTDLAPTQRRFSDGGADAWAERVAALRPSDGMTIGAAIHSVRAVPADQLGTVVEAAAHRPLHMHLSEQPAENEACVAAYGLTPTALLDQVGALTPDSTVVHATHVTDADIALLISSAPTVCMCPTTERDLADGVGPARALHSPRRTLSLGSDQHAVIDMFEEARGLELDDRLISLQRGRFSMDELHAAMTAHESIGWSDAGRLEAGARADLVAVRLDTPRTAGTDPAQIVMAATSTDIDTVIVDGVPVVAAGRHRLGDVGMLLADAIDPLWIAS
ncbi:MAG TPA: formimidoylglutamate deiminase [Jatrophihabitans sp.]